MPSRLPSLTALRAFEAAARNLSFVRAADELSVTPAAVGFQIKQLEEDLGGALFIRKYRAIELTERGRALSVRLGPAFKTIQRAWDSAKETEDPRVFRVSGPPKAIHSWVLPSLTDAKSPPTNVRFSWDLSKENRDVANGQVDMAIRWAQRPEGDLHWQPLLRTWFTPLMRADVARFVQRPEDLIKQGLIGVEFPLDAGMTETVWAPWFRVNGLKAPKDFAVTCSDTASAVDTAIATGHVAMGGSFLAGEHLHKGALVAPFDTAIAPVSRFWLVSRKGLETTDEYRWFVAALRQGAATLDAPLRKMKVFHPDGGMVET